MTKISDLTALTGAGVDMAADLLPIVDMSLSGTARNKKILGSELKIAFGLSGTNSGDQTITLTGDVTGSGTGSFAATIANNAVSFAKFVAAPSAGVVWGSGAANYAHNASGGGTTNFLRADGTWAAPPGSGGFTAASTTEVLTGTDSSKGATPDAIAALWEQGSDVASAGTISIGEGGYFNITGTTTITDIDFATDKAGRKAWVKFAGALTLTHNASTLVLPTGANITTAAGDTACFISEGTDVVRCVAYQRASGAALVSSSATSYEGGPVTAATTTDLGTWVNQGTSSVSDGTGALILKPQVDGLVHAREKTIAGSFTYYTKLDFDFLSTAAVTAAITGVAGVFLRDSSDSEIIVLGLYYERISGDEQNLYGAIIQRWTNATTFSASPVLKYNNKPWKWLKVDSNGTTLTLSVGHDGKNFTQVGTETIATFIDTVDRIGVGAIASANMTEAVVTVPYFSSTAPA